MNSSSAFRFRRWPVALLAAALWQAQPAAVHAAPTLAQTVDLSPGEDAYHATYFGINTATHKLYAAGYASPGAQYTYGVKVLDTTTGDTLAGIHITTSVQDVDDNAFDTYGIAVDDSAGPDGNKVYLFGRHNSYQNSTLAVHFIDGATDTNLTSGATDLTLANTAGIPIGLGNPIVVNSVTHKVYVLDGEDNMTVIDGPGRQIIGTVATGLDTILAHVVDRTANRLFFFGQYSTGTTGQAAIIDGATDAVTPFTTPFYGATCAAVDEAGGRVYVAAVDGTTRAATLYALDAASGAVLTSSTAGVTNYLGSLTFDASGGVLYGANRPEATTGAGIVAFDPVTLAVKANYAHLAENIGFDAGRLFLAGAATEENNAVGILNPASGAFTRTTVSYQPGAVAVNTQTGRAYIYDNEAAEVPVVDLATGAVVSRFQVVGARDGGPDYDSEPRAVAVSSALNRFYRTHLGPNNVSSGFGGFGTSEYVDAYDGGTGQLLSSTELDSSNYAHNGFIAVDDAHSRLYVSGATDGGNTEAGVLFVLDLNSAALLATVDFGSGGYTANGIAVNPNTRRVYVTSGAGRGQLGIIDGATNTLVTTFETSAGYPTVIAVNTRTNTAYIAESAGHDIEIIDGATDSDLGVFADGDGGDFSVAGNVAVDEQTNTVYVLDSDTMIFQGYKGGILSFDANNNYQRTGQVDLGYLPAGLAFDPGTRRLAVPNNIDGTVSILQEGAASHPPFFAGEAALGNGVYYLSFPNGNYFGYYSYLSDPHYVYHFDLGYEYVFDANDSGHGVYLYDFKSQGFFYTSPSFPFPYLYDFSLNTVLYYYPDPNNAGHYNTDGYRFFYRFDTGQVIVK